MASSEDYKKLYELYQVEGVPHDISIVDFCQRNGIVYSKPPIQRKVAWEFYNTFASIKYTSKNYGK